MATTERDSLRYYPLFLDVSGKRCIVIGGGQVASRKILKLLEAGADVVVISPSPAEKIRRLAREGRIVLRMRKFRKGDLRGSILAIGATDDRDVNELVHSEAGKKSILVNVVDDVRLSSFIVPSTVKRGNLLIAVSTFGESPALSREIRIELERLYGSEFGKFLNLMGTIRRRMKKSIPSGNRRAGTMRTFVREGMQALRRGKKVRDLRRSYLGRLALLEEK
ncbi:MAG: bifunctional precorrin-2 dehydrogenase/sirohydrochlorin ferrochelatase [Candidatus Eisenbacteria bacterium]|nr:bifunctional precorrin-2 dehydrogenase/sirohydrochlorin ferrochelatase [Candidatus Eisenbacteria bacterium]